MSLKYLGIFKIYVCFGVTLACLPHASYAQDTTTETTAEIAEIAEQLELYVMPETGPFRPDQIKIANQNAISDWARSGHSDSSSEAFAHWDEDGEIPPTCAVCHSGAGFRSFHGLDGSEAGLPASPVPTGGVVDCATCHDPSLSGVAEVRFPSGLMHPVSTPAEASCMTCHQGRASGQQVAAATDAKDPDTPDPELGFINPHYAVAASTWLGGYAGSGYHYPDKEYSGRFFHARPVETCVSCHEPHNLTVSENSCATCHENSTPDEIRLSRLSYDGSGDLTKGIRADIATNAKRLLGMVQDYAAQVAGTPMIYDGHSYPYFFADANGDGRVDEVDGRAVGYNAWTPRLLKAVYNWKFVSADAGAFAHNPHYALELLYDAMEDLAEPLGQDIDALGINR
ncbi:cytochrome C [Celeribacter sp.]|uniref:cytochrome C n=1 Tax=Celeribacter sp. TaxID=1890673 RepID=UPI003A903C95